MNYSQSYLQKSASRKRETKRERETNSDPKSILKSIVAADVTQVRERFGGKPITFLRAYDENIRFPKKLRNIFGAIWNGKSSRFIIKGPRGGGKSRLLGAVGFCLWFFKDRDIVDMGGSLEQAKIVYNYFQGHCYMDNVILEAMPEEPQIQKSISDKGACFKCVAASLKQIRGPHPDVLFGDEVCETKDEVVNSALPMVDTSPNALIVLTSTFHKIFGIFQEIWDSAEERGYLRFEWDIFDVALPFSSSIWNDPELNSEIPDLEKLKKRARGRTGDPEGWVPIDNIIQAWREKDTVDWFDVEYMGSRPSVAGLVNDPQDVDACSIEPGAFDKTYGYREGATNVFGVDWGFSSMTSTVGLMAAGDVVSQLFNKNFVQAPLDVITDFLCDQVEKYDTRFIYADSSGKFENNALQSKLIQRRLKCKVIEVVFSKEKEEILGNYRAYFQKRKIRISKTDREALWQHKRYRYQEGSDKPLKQDDHVPDATMCALKHWPLGRHSSRLWETEHKIDSEAPGAVTSGLLDERF